MFLGVNGYSFGGGSGPIHFGISKISCFESHYRLQECTIYTALHCTHFRDWGVYCGRGECKRDSK